LNKIKVIHKPKLFYKKFKYRVKFYCLDLYTTRYARNLEELERALYSRFERIVFLHTGTMPHEPGRLKSKLPVDIENQKRLERFLLWKLANQQSEDVLIRIDGNSGSAFSNDLEKLKELEKSVFTDSVAELEYSEINLAGDPDIITLKNPKHKYRVYLKSKVISLDFHSELASFLNLHEKSLYPCNALKTFAEAKDRKTRYWKYRWLSGSFFIEYDSESVSTLISLFLDQYLGKTYKIEKRIVSY
jgi:hypothetical protein